MIDTFEDLATFILIANAICGGWLLPVVALLLIVIVSCGLWEVTSRLRRTRPLARMAAPEYDPELDGPLTDDDFYPCPTCGDQVPLERHAGTFSDPHIIRQHGTGDCAITAFGVVTNLEEDNRD